MLTPPCVYRRLIATPSWLPDGANAWSVANELNLLCRRCVHLLLHQSYILLALNDVVLSN